MDKVYTVAHTHWDFEWYFTRQEARVQFIFHMDEVLKALENNQLDFYTLDGQMSIIEDYLFLFPDKTNQIEKFVKANRLFIGPWFTQIDEMTTSGESIIRNLRIGINEADELGQAMRIGYLPDSFGQNQDMPKIYQGFNIQYALFWRGMPKEFNARYFYWSSNDGSKVLAANIKNGYSIGSELIEKDNFQDIFNKINTDTKSNVHVLPVGGDQRAVDFNLKNRISSANKEIEGSGTFIESNYPDFFKALEKQIPETSVISGEFIEPSDSKIHRGIYSSRYDLKQLYDKLERILTYQLEPLSVLASDKGISVKQGLITSLWKVVARGQAHDSAGGCNSDKTNRDIYMRGINGLQEAQSCVDYLLRKLSISINKNRDNDLFIWNPLPFEFTTNKIVVVSTKTPDFSLVDAKGTLVEFDILNQEKENAALLRRNIKDMEDEYFYTSKIIIDCKLPSMGWVIYEIIDEQKPMSKLIQSKNIENDWYILEYKEGNFNLYLKEKKLWYQNFLTFEDGGDEGDTYDYSPAVTDWILNLDFKNAEEVITESGNLVSRILLKGQWQVPYDLESREIKNLNGLINYNVSILLNSKNNLIDFNIKIDNQTLDHRLRLLLNTKSKSNYSISDTPFGVIERQIDDDHLNDWKNIGYKEEPTSMRPFIHFANTHDEHESWSFLSKGTKDFQVLKNKYNTLAITVFRSVGFLGRPDLIRRPGDASGLQILEVPTPDSQLLGDIVFEGSIIIEEMFNAQKLQEKYLVTTQDGLFYQTQLINKFTTPIQYFTINPMQLLNKEHGLIKVDKLSVVFSSLQSTIDKTGIELRVYNPVNSEQNNPGRIFLQRPAEVKELDLEGKIVKNIMSNTTDIQIEPFNPGEIRTYGIYFC